jgi:hypothetical protein
VCTYGFWGGLSRADVSSVVRPSSIAELAPQQSAFCFLGVSPSASAKPPTTDEDAHISTQLDALLNGRDLRSSSPKPVTLNVSTISAEKSPAAPDSPPISVVLATRTQSRSTQLQAQLPMLPVDQLERIFPLFSSRSLDVVVHWSIPGQNRRYGYHQLVDLKLGASHNSIRDVVEAAGGKAGGLYAESQRERQMLLSALGRSELGVDEEPVAVSVHADEFVEHDFATG